MKLTPAQRLLCEQLRPIAAARGLRIEPEYQNAIPGRRFRIDVALLEPAAGVCWGAVEASKRSSERWRRKREVLRDLKEHVGLA